MRVIAIIEEPKVIDKIIPILMEQLDKLGFELIPVPFEAVILLGGALHCTTLDVFRERTCEDYFPKQIPGY